MQLHTYGHRLQIIASHPVPLQMSYLIYPATGGSTFHDLLIGDCQVTPAEHAVHYSESFLLLPPTYQISFYDRHTSTPPTPPPVKSIVIASPQSAQSSLNTLRSHQSQQQLSLKDQLRVQYGLPLASVNTGRYTVVFCNFNKMDKLDALSFAVWMNVLQRVPGSMLWLLKPIKHKPKPNTNSSVNSNDSESSSSSSSNYKTEPDEYFDAYAFNTLLETNLHQQARVQGVDPRRIIFAPRTSKKDHILRSVLHTQLLTAVSQ